MKIQYSIKTRLAVWITVALWASAFVGIRAGLESYTPGSLAALRFLVASFCMLILYMRLPNRNRISWRDKGKRYYYLYEPEEIYRLFESIGFKIIKKQTPDRNIIFIVEKPTKSKS